MFFEFSQCFDFTWKLSFFVQLYWLVNALRLLILFIKMYESFHYWLIPLGYREAKIAYWKHSSSLCFGFIVAFLFFSQSQPGDVMHDLPLLKVILWQLICFIYTIKKSPLLIISNKLFDWRYSTNDKILCLTALFSNSKILLSNAPCIFIGLQ